MKQIWTGNLLIFTLISLLSAPAISQEWITIPESIVTQHDSIKKYQQIDSSKAFSYARQVEALANRQDDERLSAWSTYYKANIYAYQGDFDRSEQYFKIALDDAKSLSITDHKLLSMVYANYGYLLFELGEVARHRDFSWLAYKHTIPLKDTAELATTYFNIGSAMIDLGNYKEAARYAQKALEIDQYINDSVGIGFDLGFLANIHFKKKEYDKAADMYQTCLKYFDSKRHRNQYAELLSALADVYNASEQYDRAYTTANQAYELVNGSNDVARESRALIHRSHAQFQLGQREIALSHLEKVLNVVTEKRLYREQIRAYIAMGKLDDNAGSSLGHLKKALQIATERDLSEYKALLYPLIKMRQSSFNNPLQRLAFHDEYVQFLEDRQTANLEASEASLKAMYDLMNIEEEYEMLQLQSDYQRIEFENHRYKLMAGLIGVSLLVLLLFIWFYRKHKEKQINELELKEHISTLRERIGDLLSNTHQEISLPDRDVFNKLILSPLTDKEYDILSDLIQRKSNAQIAKDHYISVNTVKFHLKNIYSKLGVSDRKRVLEKVVDLKK